jgi:hypothetical protein
LIDHAISPRREETHGNLGSIRAGCARDGRRWSPVAFLLRSPKATDLADDGRCALHAHQDPDAPHEFVVRGRARPIDDEATRQAMADAWYFDIDESYRLFEFGIEHAILGERANADDWPPHYTSRRSDGG